MAKQLPTLIFLVWYSYTTADQSDCITKIDKDVFIRPKGTIWAIDGYFSMDDHVRLMEFIGGSMDQRWRFEPSSNIGFFNILNKRTTEALDIADKYDTKDGTYTVMTRPLVDSPSQQWQINYDNTITNYALLPDYIMNVKDRSYTLRNYITMSKRGGNENSTFILTSVDTDQRWK